MRVLIVLIICVCQVTGYAQVMWQVKTDTVKEWFYADGDEFNSNVINLGKWTYAPAWGNAVVNQSVYFTNGQNVRVDSGIINFVAKREDIMGHVWEWEYDPALLKRLKLEVVDQKLPFKYTAGALWSKRKYKHGFFECRFKSNAEKGIWPAFWLYAGRENDEIDWFELKGERPDQAHVDVHCPKGCTNFRGGFLKLKRGWGGWIKFSRPLNEEYNVIAGEWNEKYMTWYLNGEPLCYFEHRYDSAMWLIVNTSVASNTSGFKPGPDQSTKFPNEFKVDYVRIWSARDTSNVPSSNFVKTEPTMSGLHPDRLARMKKRLKYMYNKKALSKELGYVTLLPLTGRRYSVTVHGRQPGAVRFEILNGKNEKIKELAAGNTNYSIIDLAGLPGGTYTIKIYVFGKELTRRITLG